MRSSLQKLLSGRGSGNFIGMDADESYRNVFMRFPEPLPDKSCATLVNYSFTRIYPCGSSILTCRGAYELNQTEFSPSSHKPHIPRLSPGYPLPGLPALQNIPGC